jgi:heme-degrading monooxygenase HmoA
MLIKWIACHVQETQNSTFAEAQTAWGALATVDGFCGQWGGWNTHNPLEARIIAFWRNRSAYDHFMSRIHDFLFDASGQRQAFQSISVTLSESIMEIPDEKISLPKALASEWLRMADCTVKPERKTHFLKAQRTVWNPAIGQADGMLGAIVARVVAEPVRFHLFSFWRNEQTHSAYAQTVPDLVERAGTKHDTVSVTGCWVRLEERWRVLPQRG